jgi:hypothetical protein
MVPDGYIGYSIKHPSIAATLAELDYPIVVEHNSKNPGRLDTDSSVGIHLTPYGERYWIFEPEFWHLFWQPITWYRFSLIEDGVPKAICTTGLKQLGEGDVWSVPCKSYTYHDFQLPFVVDKHVCKSLIGMLDYWVGGNDKDPPGEDVPADYTVTRPYYLIPEK